MRFRHTDEKLGSELYRRALEKGPPFLKVNFRIASHLDKTLTRLINIMTSLCCRVLQRLVQVLEPLAY